MYFFLIYKGNLQKYCLTHYTKNGFLPKSIWKNSFVCSIDLSIMLTGETDTLICRIWNIPWWPDFSHTWRTFFFLFISLLSPITWSIIFISELMFRMYHCHQQEMKILHLQLLSFSQFVCPNAAQWNYEPVTHGL